jgi:hypothetical protein
MRSTMTLDTPNNNCGDFGEDATHWQPDPAKTQFGYCSGRPLQIIWPCFLHIKWHHPARGHWPRAPAAPGQNLPLHQGAQMRPFAHPHGASLDPEASDWPD